MRLRFYYPPSVQQPLAGVVKRAIGAADFRAPSLGRDRASRAAQLHQRGYQPFVSLDRTGLSSSGRSSGLFR